MRSYKAYLRWTPHPVIVTMRANGNYIRFLFCYYYTSITGLGGSSLRHIRLAAALPPNPKLHALLPLMQVHDMSCVQERHQVHMRGKA